jgi:hypothetical protein
MQLSTTQTRFILRFSCKDSLIYLQNYGSYFMSSILISALRSKLFDHFSITSWSNCHIEWLALRDLLSLNIIVQTIELFKCSRRGV